MDQGYNEEAADQIQESKELLNTFKLVAEYFYHRDQFNTKEMRFAKAAEEGWAYLTDTQKDIVYCHVIQGFSFSCIADIKGISPQAVSQAFHRACKHFQTV